MLIGIRRGASILGALALTFALLPAAGPAHAATFTVNDATDLVDSNTSDGQCRTAANTCTLRAAIQQANALGGAHTITLPAGTFTLTISNPNLDLNGDGVPDDEANPTSGDLDIMPPAGGALTLEIRGAGRDQYGRHRTLINGNGAVSKDRVFDIHGASVAISQLAIKNGNPPGKSGGGIRNQGILTLNEVMVRDNTASNGGGVRSSGSGSLTVNNSTIRNNIANEGGGIRANHTVTISGSDISDNKAGYNAAGSVTAYGFGGGIDIDKGAPATISKSTIKRNASSGKGGGIDNDGALKITDSTISDNRAQVDGGGIDNTGATAPLSLTNTSVTGNSPNNCSPSPCP
jgi:hypothetical protein